MQRSKCKILCSIVFGALILIASLTMDDGHLTKSRWTSFLPSRDELLKLRNISSNSTAAYIERLTPSSNVDYIKRIGFDLKDKFDRLGIAGEENELRGNSGISLTWDRYGDLTTIFGWRPKDLQESLLRDYKNPCLLIDDNLYCLPFFFVAGMPYSGTEDIWSKLTQHHYVAHTIRDPHWWTRGMGADVSMRAYSFQLTTDFRNHLRHARKPYDVKATTKMIVGDGSSSTFCDNLLWKKNKGVGRGPGTFQMIKGILPKAKFIISLSEPANRLYSEYIDSSQSKPQTSDSYHTVVTRAKQMLEVCIRRLGARRCAFSTTVNEATETAKLPRIHLSLYLVFIKEFLKYFPRDQLFIIRMEDWDKGCTEILPELFKFLELDPLPIASINPICMKRKQISHIQVNVTAGKQLAETKRMVRKFVAPYHQELADMLEDPRFLWSDID